MLRIEKLRRIELKLQIIHFRNSIFTIILEFRREQDSYLNLKHRAGKSMLNLMGNHFVLYTKKLHHHLISLVYTAAMGIYDDKITHFMSILNWFNNVFLCGSLDHFLNLTVNPGWGYRHFHLI